MRHTSLLLVQLTVMVTAALLVGGASVCDELLVRDEGLSVWLATLSQTLPRTGRVEHMTLLIPVQSLCTLSFASVVSPPYRSCGERGGLTAAAPSGARLNTFGAVGSVACAENGTSLTDAANE